MLVAGHSLATLLLEWRFRWGDHPQLAGNLRSNTVISHLDISWNDLGVSPREVSRVKGQPFWGVSGFPRGDLVPPET